MEKINWYLLNNPSFLQISDRSDPTLAFIEDIFKKRQWGKLIKGVFVLFIEVVSQFYANYEYVNIDDHFITSTI